MKASSRWLLGVGCFGCAGLLVTFVLVGGLFRSASKSLKAIDAAQPRQPTSFHPVEGQFARLSVPSGAVVVCRSKQCLEEFHKLSRANDIIGIAELVMSGRALDVESGTKVLVIDHAWEERKVRIMEGKHLGAAGWVSRVFLTPP